MKTPEYIYSKEAGKFKKVWTAEDDAKIAALTERIVELESIASSAKNERQLWEENFNRVEAERDALRADADKFGDALLLAATSCPHSIDSNRIVLHFDANQAGHNALNQLSTRLRAAIDNERSKK